ncbi:hypothetical protein AVEN_142147-1 [Araneus ventricosus]|uniref:Uncharacterized protein n=1 Tax=Araneus ventricosus TaxID=182803 RepID=A0A4Y2DIT8_ARAVE|nr:hypothetical protein AVEN_142147-1 [Araneus ventricosus]
MGLEYPLHYDIATRTLTDHELGRIGKIISRKCVNQKDGLQKRPVRPQVLGAVREGNLRVPVIRKIRFNYSKILDQTSTEISAERKLISS